MQEQSANGTSRLLVIVVIAIIVAIASFENTIAMTLCMTALVIGSGVIIFVLIGAASALVREKPSVIGVKPSNNPPRGNFDAR